MMRPEDFEGPGCQRWMDVYESEKDLLEFYSKCVAFTPEGELLKRPFRVVDWSLGKQHVIKKLEDEN